MAKKAKKPSVRQLSATVKKLRARVEELEAQLRGEMKYNKELRALIQEHEDADLEKVTTVQNAVREKDEAERRAKSLHWRNKRIINASNKRRDVLQKQIKLQEKFNAGLVYDVESLAERLSQHASVAVASTLLFLLNRDDLTPGGKYKMFSDMCTMVGTPIKDLGDTPKDVFTSATGLLLENLHADLIQDGASAENAEQEPSREKALRSLDELLEHIVEIVKAG
jgi:vacuolar-type H+-ATPase subunit I/STV1